MLESAESQVPKLIIREIVFEEFQPRVITIHQRCRQTDGKTDNSRPTYHGNTALHYASHGKKYNTLNIPLTTPSMSPSTEFFAPSLEHNRDL